MRIVWARGSHVNGLLDKLPGRQAILSSSRTEGTCTDGPNTCCERRGHYDITLIYECWQLMAYILGQTEGSWLLCSAKLLECG